MRRIAVVVIVLAIAVLLAWIRLVGTGRLGTSVGPGQVAEATRPTDSVAARAAQQRATARLAGVSEPKQILFGDLHVHSTYSTDAFLNALPPAGGAGARPVSDACDFARYCATLDFWSINDHASTLPPRAWQETIETIRQCNAVAGSEAEPDVVAFLGWEWTQIGSTPDNHYGHKNVVLRHTGSPPPRPIGAKPPADAFDRDPDAQPGILALGFVPLLIREAWSLDFVRYMRDLEMPDCPVDAAPESLPAGCRMWVETPAELFSLLDRWDQEAVVIPHGTTWGFYTPMGSAWDKQLRGDLHDPARQTLIEVFSGHGNSEEFRAWDDVAFGPDGRPRCPEPAPGYLPSCWRAGEIVLERCRAAGEAEASCEERAATARQHYVEADLMGHLTVPGATPEDWLDAGQCADCFQPSFNYRPRSSVQYIMALRDWSGPGPPRRFELGFMASSDNHTSRPGTGYKEYARTEMTEARLTEAMLRIWGGRPAEEPLPESVAFDPARGDLQFHTLREAERATSYFLTGGLIAAHTAGRSRDAIWDAMSRREVYGTSGPRILLWFDLLNPPGSRGQRAPMGAEVELGTNPIFQVRAVGSFEQEPGCPDFASQALGPERLASICKGECYNPSDRRRPVTRIEVVRVRPQQRADEDVAGLIEDPWRVFECAPDPAGCAVTFEDPDYRGAGRDTVYYVRAFEEEKLAINAGGVRCQRDEAGRCTGVELCGGDPEDDCLAPHEPRAWSSPIWIDWTGAPVSAAPAGAERPDRG